MPYLWEKRWICDDEGNAIEATEEEWMAWMREEHMERIRGTAPEKQKRVIARTHLPNGCWVSTVFLTIDHSMDGITPVLWETMVFDCEDLDIQRRYTSLQDARKGHDEVIVEILLHQAEK
jgi:hypothetical protein